MGGNKKKRKNNGKKQRPEQVPPASLPAGPAAVEASSTLVEASPPSLPPPPPSSDNDAVTTAVGAIDDAVPESAPVTTTPEGTREGDEEVSSSPTKKDDNDVIPAEELSPPDVTVPLVTDEEGTTAEPDVPADDAETPTADAVTNMEAKGSVDPPEQQGQQEEASSRLEEEIVDAAAEAEEAIPVPAEPKSPIEGAETSDAMAKLDQEAANLPADEEETTAIPNELERSEADAITEESPSVEPPETNGNAASSAETKEETMVEPLQNEVEEEASGNSGEIVEAKVEEEACDNSGEIVEAKVEEEDLNHRHHDSVEKEGDPQSTLSKKGENEASTDMDMEESPSDEFKDLPQETELKDEDITQQDDETEVDSKHDVVVESAAKDNSRNTREVVQTDHVTSPPIADETTCIKTVSSPEQESFATPGTDLVEETPVLDLEVENSCPGPVAETNDAPTVADDGLQKTAEEALGRVTSEETKKCSSLSIEANTAPLNGVQETRQDEETKPLGSDELVVEAVTDDTLKVQPPTSTPGVSETTKTPKESTARPSGMTFAKAFSPNRSEQVPKKSPSTSPGMTFAQAFGSEKIASAPSMPVPASVESKGDELVLPPSLELQVTPNLSFERMVAGPNSSHSALSAAKNKKVSGLVSKYISEVAKEPLPGDSIPIRKNSSASLMPSPRPSPVSTQSNKHFVIPEVELSTLPDMNSVREMFETTSRSSGSTPVFEFGESFRQKQRYELLSDKEKEREAKASLHGFDEKEINNGRTATGEIDTASLPKTFTFEMTSIESIELHDGSCKVDYKNVDYKAMVFVVHRTRGMLLLHCNVKVDGKRNKKATKSNDNRKCQIPGGMVLEEDFLRAAKQSGNSQVQLQIAAREAAARQLFEKTGLDVRTHVDRFKPAVLRLNPPVDARGVQYLKNENDNMLYYFLQVDEDDFVMQTTEGENEKLTRASEDPGDSPLTLRLCDDYNGFTFVHDPADAARILKDDGDTEATIALHMIMNEASGEVQGVASANAKASGTASCGDSVPADERSGTLRVGRIRTVGDGQHEGKTTISRNAEVEMQEGNPGSGGNGVLFHNEADLIVKSSKDTQDAVEVACCCGWW